MITAQPEAELKGVTLVNKLRQNGISAEKDYLKRKFKAQLKDANRKMPYTPLFLVKKNYKQAIIN